MVESAHEAIVAPEIFDEVQRILAGRHRTYSPNSRYLLSCMVTCYHCGRNMTGVYRSLGGSCDRKERYYFCDRKSLSNHRGDPNCPHPAVRIERLESFVLKAVRQHLLDKGADKGIRQAIVRARSKNALQTTQDEKRLQELRRKIDRGTENLALADKRDFAAISNLLTAWREEEAEVAERIERRRAALEPLPEALEIIRQLGAIQKRLTDAHHAKLQYALRQTIASIRVGVRKATMGSLTYREHFGELRFHNALLPGKVIPIPDEAIGVRKIWREIGAMVRGIDRPLRLTDVCLYLGTKDHSLASYHVRRAVRAGLLRKVGWVGGWVATG
ncbi:MAG: hypothetical protein A2V98_07470 [Planctomycetes bacterium RBG_16_64_12]|nr:MAG: hypothetical protein A2V98_07470 [Planctomycetes bacterium RBG_16_64_12]